MGLHLEVATICTFAMAATRVTAVFAIFQLRTTATENSRTINRRTPLSAERPTDANSKSSTTKCTNSFIDNLILLFFLPSIKDTYLFVSAKILSQLFSEYDFEYN